MTSLEIIDTFMTQASRLNGYILGQALHETVSIDEAGIATYSWPPNMIMCVGNPPAMTTTEIAAAALDAYPDRADDLVALASACVDFYTVQAAIAASPAPDPYVICDGVMTELQAQQLAALTTACNGVFRYQSLCHDLVPYGMSALAPAPADVA